MLQFNHFNFNVLDLERSLAFYRQALELEVVEEKEAGDGSFKLVYLGDGGTGFRLELTWLRDRTEPYDLGEQEFHLAFVTDRFDALLRGTGPWAAYALKTRIWAFTSLRIRTATGSSSSRSGGKG